MKNILITGSSSGIGKSLVLIFAQNGFNVFTCARSIKPIEYSDFNNIYYKQIDLENPELALNFFEDCEKISDGIDILLNNAGIGLFEKLEKFDIEDIYKSFNLNYFTPTLLIKKSLESKIGVEGGIIVNINSIASIKAFSNSSIYAGTKSALLALSRSLRLELVGRNVKIIDFLPGATSSQIWNENTLNIYKEKMMDCDSLAKFIFSTINSSLQGNLVPEELVIRPITGDL